MIEPWVDFERGFGDSEQVCARIHLGLDVTLTLWSDEATSPRDWEFEEVELDLDDKRPVTFSTRHMTKLSAGVLYDFLTREWDREVSEEAKRAAASRGQAVLDVG